MWKIIGILFAIGLVAGFIGLLVDILIVAIPYILAVGCAAALCWGLWAAVRWHRKKKREIPSDIDSLLKKTGGSSASTRQQADAFLRENALVRSFHTRVVGVTYDNDDGSSRQEILSHCLRGEPVGFYWHDFQGRPACAVISDRGQIGYLSADLAEDLHFDYQDDRYSLVAHISDITGGQDGYSYGCNLLLSIYETVR